MFVLGTCPVQVSSDVVQIIRDLETNYDIGYTFAAVTNNPYSALQLEKQTRYLGMRDELGPESQTQCPISRIFLSW